MTQAKVIQMPVKTKLVCSKCGAPGEGSCHCGAPYVSPGERAEAAVKANPEMSDRAIADAIRVSNQTVSRARKATVTNVTVEKRTGKDGKKRKVRKTPSEKFRAAVRSRYQGKTQTEAAKDAGLGSVQTVKIAEAYEQGRSDLLDQLNIDPETLAVSSKAKLELAKRHIEYKLNIQHAERMRNLDEEVRKRVLEEGKEYLAMLQEKRDKADRAEQWFQEMINNHKPIFTIDQFNLIRKCLHQSGVAATAKDFDTAFDLVQKKKLQLTGQA